MQPSLNINYPVAALQRGEFTVSHLEALRASIKAGAGPELIRFAITDETGEITLQAIGRVMKNLEALARQDELAACCLMAQLWRPAGERMLRDICDAIDLWLQHGASPALKVYLEQLTRAETDVNLLRHYRGWLENQPPQDEGGAEGVMS